VLGNVACRDDNLSLADVVVLEEYHLQEVANFSIVVDDLADLVDQVDDCLGHPVARCCFTTENADTRLNLLALLCGHVLQLEVAVDHTKDVQLLTLVLVNSLHLNVEQA
jgi:hypothetical protein